MTTVTPTTSFADFGVEPTIVAALLDAGISTPFPIQELTLPLALTGADIIGQARTGTGKTLAFGIPLLARIDAESSGVRALVIVPTRELCIQVTGDLNQAGVRKGIDVAAVYGGRAMEPQIEAIEGGAQVIVGTPGRLLDLMRRGYLNLSGVTALVLDEADEMLDLGFLPDVERLIEATAPERQTLLYSATMPSAVVGLARRYMSKPTFLRAEVEEAHIAPQTQQYFFSCHRMDKPAVIARILETPQRGLTLIFSRTKRMCDILAEELRTRGIQAAPIHSDLRQEARERTLQRFRDGKTTVLVATEVAARGLDIDDVTHVVNYDCPDDEKMYLHRIGRTGRAGAAGVAITLALWNELARLEMIKRALDIDAETHEVFSTSEILDELFDLPPRSARRPVGDDDGAGEERATPRGEAARGAAGQRRNRGRGRDGDDARGGKGRDGSDRRGRGGSGSRGDGRGRGRDRQQDAQVSATATDADDEEFEITAGDPDSKHADGGPSRTRARQRTRSVAEDGDTPEVRTSQPVTPAGAGGEASAESKGRAEAEEGGATEVRTRSRSRRRTTTSSRGQQGDVRADEGAGTSSESSTTSEDKPGRRGSRRSRNDRDSAGRGDNAGRGGRDSGGRGGRDDGGGGGRGDSAGRGGRDDGGRGDSASRGGRDDGDDRGERGRSGRGRGENRGRQGGRGRGEGGGDGRRRDGDQGRRGRRPVVDSDEARGTGKPQLRRPLEIEHLP